MDKPSVFPLVRALGFGKDIQTRLVAAATALITLGFSPVQAGTIGIAVDAVGSSHQVGLTEDRAIGDDAIKYFIPLRDASGVYGTGRACAHGFGTCSDSGDGGGTLHMILQFAPVSTTTSSVLSIVFEDLDLKNVNDPDNFFEKLNVLKANSPTSFTSLTGWITKANIGEFVTGDANSQQLTLELGILTQSPIYLELDFRAYSKFYGKNTPEYLIATISENISTTPVPGPFAGTGLPGIAVLFGILITIAGRRRKSPQRS